MTRNKNQAPKESNYRRRRTVASGTAIAALIGAGSAFITQGDEGARKHFDKIETEAIKEAKEGWNSVIAVHAGVTYRTAPKSVTSGEEGTPDTVAGKVPEGKVLRIDRPVPHVEEFPDPSQNNYWFGFTLRPEKGETTDGADNENVYWVNFSQLQRESNAENNLVDVYNYTVTDDATNQLSTGPANYKILIDADGNFTNDLGQKGGSAATASFIPESIFEQMVANEPLELNHGK